MKKMKGGGGLGFCEEDQVREKRDPFKQIKGLFYFVPLPYF